MVGWHGLGLGMGLSAPNLAGVCTGPASAGLSPLKLLAGLPQRHCAAMQVGADPTQAYRQLAVKTQQQPLLKR